MASKQVILWLPCKTVLTLRGDASSSALKSVNLDFEFQVKAMINDLHQSITTLQQQ
jgi:hypothetical protein